MKNIVILIGIVFFLPIFVSAQTEDLDAKIKSEFSKEQLSVLKDADNNIKKANVYVAQADKLKASKPKKALKLHKKAAKLYNKYYKISYNLRKKKLEELREKSDDIKETAFDFLYQEAVNSYREAVSQRIKAENAKNKKEALAFYEAAKLSNEKSYDYQDESFAVYFDLTDFEQYSAVKDYTEEAVTNGKNQTSNNTDTEDVQFTDDSFSTDETYTVAELTSGKPDTDIAENSKSDASLYNSDVIFKIQIAASTKPMSQTALKRKYNKGKIEHEKDGVYHKYVVGKYSNYKDAYNAKQNMAVPGAFVVAYKNGVRVNSPSEFKQIVPEKSNTVSNNLPTTEVSDTSNNSEGIEYRIQLATSRLPASKKQIADLNPTDLEVKIYKSKVYYKYTVGSFKSKTEARNYINAFGLEKVIIVKYKNNREIK